MVNHTLHVMYKYSSIMQHCLFNKSIKYITKSYVCKFVQNMSNLINHKNVVYNQNQMHFVERKRIYKYVSVMLIYILHSIGIASYPWNVYCKETRFFLHIEIFYDWLTLHLVSQSLIKISYY